MKRNGIYFFIAFISLVVIGYWFLQREDTPFNNSNYKEIDDFESGKPLEGGAGIGVSSSNPYAVQVGMDILENGGNAVDAAIAISYALGVVEPHASGIGGGGGMLILPGDKDRAPTFFDYRETSPISGSHPTRGVGIPGFVKGMDVIHRKYGTKTMADLIDPSIKLAEKGFPVQQPLQGLLKRSDHYRLSVKNLPSFYPNGRTIKQDELLTQPELAETLKLIKEQGPDAFYNGKIAEDIARKVDGISLSDIRAYSAYEREPVYGEFLGYEVITAPPPFSGITLIQSLQMAEMLKVQELANDPINFMHVTREIFKRTYSKRIQYIGDPDFVGIPVKKLTAMDYSKQLAADISYEKQSDQYEIDDDDLNEESVSTTHLVVTDKEGTVVSATNTLGHFFGTGINVRGFFLNGSVNMFSDYSSSPNNFESGKRSRTFTAPTILRNDERTIGIGTPGGARIPVMLTEVLIRYLGFDESLETAIEAPRFSFENNKITTETRYPAEVTDELNAKGYHVEMNNSTLYFGGIQTLVIDENEENIYGGADSRRGGTWQVK